MSFTWRSNLSSRMSDRSNMPTPFQVRSGELDTLKQQSLNHMKRLNSLRINYASWFEQSARSFTDTIKAVQVGLASLAPQELTTMTLYRTLMERANCLPATASGTHAHTRLQQFIDFWEQYCCLKEELDETVYREVDNFTLSVTRLRQPEIKEQIDSLYTELCGAWSETFTFTGLHNEKDNLFTYRLNMCDHRLHGLVAYLPYLINLHGKICFLITKLHIEKL